MAVLRNHVLQVHDALETGVSYICTMCDKSYNAKNYLLNHIRQMHLPRRYKCTQCLYEFPHQYMLRNHMSKCKGYPIIMKPFRCTRCNRYFNLKGNLTRHLRTPGRCHRIVRNYADYIVMVRSKDGNDMRIEQMSDGDDRPTDGQPVTMEALQASEALQQLQASGSIQQIDLQDQTAGQDDIQILDGSLDQEYSQEKQNDVIAIEDLKNLISLPDGLQPMNIKKDADGNLIIEVHGEQLDATNQQFVLQGNNTIQILPEHQETDLQVVGQDENVNHQWIQSSGGQYILQTMSGMDNSEVQVEAIEVTDPYNVQVQEMYQIGADGTLQQLVESGVEDGNIESSEHKGVTVVQGDALVQMMETDSGEVQVWTDVT